YDSASFEDSFNVLVQHSFDKITKMILKLHDINVITF
ncbi:MAG: hypothetical protein RBG13Loki_3687, partial [Promethearchaeota archaeon CR_4]